MKKFDVLVVGSGAGLEVASFAAEKGLSVAIVEEGPLGGTCLNRGCIPSKMLIHSADVAETIKSSQKFGIKSKIEKIDFTSIIKRVSEVVDTDSGGIEKAIRESRNPTLYKMRGKFIGPKQMQVGDEQIEADKVFIVGGTRLSIPPLPGLDSTPYLDSTKALRLKKQPEHLVAIGGGYIAAELAHFYGALGTKITILVRGNRMLDNEDEEISNWFTKEFSKKYETLFQTEAEAVSYQDGKFTIKLKGDDNNEQSSSSNKIVADQLLVATGRVPNTDILDVKATGVETDAKGYIKVNEYLETNVEGILAFGDILGILPFRHTANDQVSYSIRNAFTNRKVPFDPFAIGHAVFSSPQVGGVGKTEQELKKMGTSYKVGRAQLKDTGMGGALQENGLSKVLTDETGKKILGVHIVGPQASVLIHEAIVAMKARGTVDAITNSVYIHPALPEWLQRAFFDIG